MSKLPKGWKRCDACKEFHLPEVSLVVWTAHRLAKRYREEFIKRWCDTHAILPEV